MTKQTNKNPTQYQGGDDCLLGRKSNPEPPDTILIPLNNNGFAIIDRGDYDIVSKYKWYLKKEKYTSYAIANYNSGKKQTSIRMHRLIMKARKGRDIDHINHNGLDNRRENLRTCTRSQNMMNQRKRRGFAKYKGVCWHKTNKKWLSSIKLKTKSTHLGYFTCIIKAAKAYDTAAIKHFGKFAKVNFPRTDQL